MRRGWGLDRPAPGREHRGGATAARRGRQRVAVTDNESGATPDEDRRPAIARATRPGTTISAKPARTAEETYPMEQKRDATRVDEPAGEPPDKDLAFDPTMTDTDEANLPPDSAADPTSDAPDDQSGSGLLGDPGVGRGDDQDDRAEQDLARRLGHAQHVQQRREHGEDQRANDRPGILRPDRRRSRFRRLRRRRPRARR